MTNGLHTYAALAVQQRKATEVLDRISAKRAVDLERQPLALHQ